MNYLYKIISVFLSILFFTGCGDKESQSNSWQLIDLSKKGVVYENDINLEEDDIFYRFSIGFIQDIESKREERNKFKVLYSGDELYKYISVFRIMGMGGHSIDTNKYKMSFNGVKTILKFTLIPHDKNSNKYKYRRGDDSFNKILTSQEDNKFEITMDLSKYPYLSSTYAKDNNKDSSYNKRICEISLKKGKYHIKIENLNDIPEIKKIRTTFTIEPATYGKGF